MIRMGAGKSKQSIQSNTGQPTDTVSDKKIDPPQFFSKGTSGLTNNNWKNWAKKEKDNRNLQAKKLEKKRKIMISSVPVRKIKSYAPPIIKDMVVFPLMNDPAKFVKDCMNDFKNSKTKGENDFKDIFSINGKRDKNNILIFLFRNDDQEPYTILFVTASMHQSRLYTLPKNYFNLEDIYKHDYDKDELLYYAEPKDHKIKRSLFQEIEENIVDVYLGTPNAASIKFITSPSDNGGLTTLYNICKTNCDKLQIKDFEWGKETSTNNNNQEQINSTANQNTVRGQNKPPSTVTFHPPTGLNQSNTTNQKALTGQNQPSSTVSFHPPTGSIQSAAGRTQRAKHAKRAKHTTRRHTKKR